MTPFADFEELASMANCAPYIPPRGELSDAEICSHCRFFDAGACIRQRETAGLITSRDAEDSCDAFEWLPDDENENSAWSPFPFKAFVYVPHREKIILILDREFRVQRRQNSRPTAKEMVDAARTEIKKGLIL